MKSFALLLLAFLPFSFASDLVPTGIEGIRQTQETSDDPLTFDDTRVQRLCRDMELRFVGNVTCGCELKREGLLGLVGAVSLPTAVDMYWILAPFAHNTYPLPSILLFLSSTTAASTLRIFALETPAVSLLTVDPSRSDLVLVHGSRNLSLSASLRLRRSVALTRTFVEGCPSAKLLPTPSVFANAR